MLVWSLLFATLTQANSQVAHLPYFDLETCDRISPEFKGPKCVASVTGLLELDRSRLDDCLLPASDGGSGSVTVEVLQVDGGVLISLQQAGLLEREDQCVQREIASSIPPSLFTDGGCPPETSTPRSFTIGSNRQFPLAHGGAAVDMRGLMEFVRGQDALFCSCATPTRPAPVPQEVDMKLVLNPSLSGETTRLAFAEITSPASAFSRCVRDGLAKQTLESPRSRVDIEIALTFIDSRTEPSPNAPLPLRFDQTQLLQNTRYAELLLAAQRRSIYLAQLANLVRRYDESIGPAVNVDDREGRARLAAQSAQLKVGLGVCQELAGLDSQRKRFAEEVRRTAEGTRDAVAAEASRDTAWAGALSSLEVELRDIHDEAVSIASDTSSDSDFCGQLAERLKNPTKRWTVKRHVAGDRGSLDTLLNEVEHDTSSNDNRSSPPSPERVR